MDCAQANNQAARARGKAFTDAIKIAKGCVDCGYNQHPAALDFDHLPGTPKLTDVSRLKHRTKAMIEAEIALCEVRCANCHRIKTAERQAESRNLR